MDNIFNEVHTHWRLRQCEGVVELKEIYEDASYIYLVLEFQASGSLLKLLLKERNFSENETRIIML
jgi:serine/threonine protein kinase